MGDNNNPKKRGMNWHLNRSAKGLRGIPEPERLPPKPLKLKPIKCGCMSCVKLREEIADGDKG